MTRDGRRQCETDTSWGQEAGRHLEKILASKAFANAPRAQQFLRFVVEERLAGRSGALTEPVVAARVFNRRDDFDRRTNSIVRAEATHVRRRLHEYYVDAGASDSLIIELPRGAYVPVIRVRTSEGTKPKPPGRRPLAAFLSSFWPGRDTSRK